MCTATRGGAATRAATATICVTKVLVTPDTKVSAVHESHLFLRLRSRSGLLSAGEGLRAGLPAGLRAGDGERLPLMVKDRTILHLTQRRSCTDGGRGEMRIKGGNVLHAKSPLSQFSLFSCFKISKLECQNTQSQNVLAHFEFRMPQHFVIL